MTYFPPDPEPWWWVQRKQQWVDQLINRELRRAALERECLEMLASLWPCDGRQMVAADIGLA